GAGSGGRRRLRRAGGELLAPAASRGPGLPSPEAEHERGRPGQARTAAGRMTRKPAAIYLLAADTGRPCRVAIHWYDTRTAFRDAAGAAKPDEEHPACSNRHLPH